ncbi:putative C6 zinc finger protein [Seiridium cardinale]
MARRGIQRLKTGCTTCKIRKIRCDEGRPQCFRCLSTGRRCDGYLPAAPGTYSWSQLLHLETAPIQAALDAEPHIISYFRHVVAPSISGPLDSHLWTSVVMQISSQQAAAKHAVLAISSLYKTMNINEVVSPCHAREDALVARHYNEAIVQLRTVQDQDTVLLVCILFICIDFLRGDHQSAVDHCRHGINILNGMPNDSEHVRDHLRPAFCRLSIFPYFFGASPSTFPDLEYPWTHPTREIWSLEDAHASLTPLLARVVRFVRSADTYRLGLVATPHCDSDTTHTQLTIEASLNSWLAAFNAFKKHRIQKLRNDHVVKMLEVRWLVCNIWLATCFSKDESIYDTHMDKFQAIVDLTTEAVIMMNKANTPRKGRFVFEMSFGPFLAFVVIKCRSLKLRMTALRLMEELSPLREHCWDMAVLSALGRRTIEVEHDLKLDTNIESGSMILNKTLPPEERRIMDSIMQQDSDVLTGNLDIGASRRRVCFLMKDPFGDGITNRDESLLVD